MHPLTADQRNKREQREFGPSQFHTHIDNNEAGIVSGTAVQLEPITGEIHLDV